VHIGCRLEPGTRVPIGWVAVGDPAQLLLPDDVDTIRGALQLRSRVGWVRQV
jgi:hypothetical protein